MPTNIYDPWINESAQRYGINPTIVKTAMHLESDGNANVEDSTARPEPAVGLMQILPSTARGMPGPQRNPRVAREAIDLGAQYLKEGADATGTAEGTLAYYHGGPNRSQWGDKTAAYVAKGLRLFPQMGLVASAAQPASAQPSSQQPAAASTADGRAIFQSLTGGAPSADPEPAAPGMSGQDIFRALTKEPPVNPALEPTLAPTSEQEMARSILPPAAGGVAKIQDAVTQAPAATARISQAAVDAANAGAQGNDVLTPRGTALMRDWNIYPPQPGGGTFMQRANEQIGDAIGGGANLLSGAVRGLIGGAAQTGTEVAGPNFGRAVGGVLEAGLADAGSRMPMRAPDAMRPLAGWPRLAADLPQESSYRPPILPVQENAFIPGSPMPEAANANRLAPAGMPMNDNPGAAPGVPANANGGAPISAAPPVEPPAAIVPPEAVRPGMAPVAEPVAPVAPAEPIPSTEPAAGVPGAKSLGAAASNAEEANISPAQERSNRTMAERERLTQAQPLGEDNNEYIKGVQPTEAQMVQNARVSRNEKLVASQMPEGFKELAIKNNEVRGEHLQDTAQSPVQMQTAIDNRSASAARNIDLAFNDPNYTKPADASSVESLGKKILAGPDGKLSEIKKDITSAMNGLYDSSGKLETDPEMLYGAKKHIDSLIEDAGGIRADSASKRSVSLLSDMKDEVNAAIEKARPGYRTYLNEFARDSKPIDEMKAIQPYLVPGKAYDTQGRVTLGGVQRMLKDIVGQRSQAGFTAADSISSPTMERIWNLRDDLRRVASSDELARAAGSDSVPLIMDLAKKAGHVLAHGVAAKILPVAGNMMINSLSGKMAERSLKKDVARALDPPNRLVPRDPLD